MHGSFHTTLQIPTYFDFEHGNNISTLCTIYKLTLQMARRIPD